MSKSEKVFHVKLSAMLHCNACESRLFYFKWSSNIIHCIRILHNACPSHLQIRAFGKPLSYSHSSLSETYFCTLAWDQNLWSQVCQSQNWLKHIKQLFKYAFHCILIPDQATSRHYFVILQMRINLLTVRLSKLIK